MRHDACVEVTCDGRGCRESAFVTLPNVYAHVSGAGRRLDDSARTVNNRLKDTDDWWVDPENDDRHLCPGCKEDE